MLHSRNLGPGDWIDLVPEIQATINGIVRKDKSTAQEQFTKFERFNPVTMKFKKSPNIQEFYSTSAESSSASPASSTPSLMINKYVVVKKEKEMVSKLSPTYEGPFKIMDLKNKFRVTLEDGREIHSSRLLPVNIKEGEVPAPVEELFIVERLLDIRRNKDGVECLVKWWGHKNPTWQSLNVLIEDIPDMVKAFLSKNKEGKKYLHELDSL
jgi:hypothetical protein